MNIDNQNKDWSSIPENEKVLPLRYARAALQASKMVSRIPIVGIVEAGVWRDKDGNVVDPPEEKK